VRESALPRAAARNPHEDLRTGRGDCKEACRCCLQRILKQWQSVADAFHGQQRLNSQHIKIAKPKKCKPMGIATRQLILATISPAQLVINKLVKRQNNTRLVVQRYVGTRSIQGPTFEERRANVLPPAAASATNTSGNCRIIYSEFQRQESGSNHERQPSQNDNLFAKIRHDFARAPLCQKRIGAHHA